MELLRALKADHARMRGLCERLLGTSERAVKARKSGFKQLKELVESHARAEEEVLYLGLVRRKTEKDPVLEGYEEHHLADVLLPELEAMPVTDERWSAKLEVLKECLEHHMEEEEDEMFANAREAFSRDELARMGQRFALLRNELREKARKGRRPEGDAVFASRKAVEASARA